MIIIQILALVSVLVNASINTLAQNIDYSLSGFPKIENFHPPEGYQPVKGYEPPNYYPDLKFLNENSKQWIVYQPTNGNNNQNMQGSNSQYPSFPNNQNQNVQYPSNSNQFMNQNYNNNNNNWSNMQNSYSTSSSSPFNPPNFGVTVQQGIKNISNEFEANWRRTPPPNKSIQFLDFV